MRAGPDYIQFYPTLRCNRSCGFCFNRALPSRPDMSLPDFRLLLDRLPGTVTTLDILGGEPTLHGDIVSLIGMARGRGLQVNLSSNGTDSAVLQDIINAGSGVTIGISINDRKILAQVSGLIRTHKFIVKAVYSKSLNLRLINDILAAGPNCFYLLYRDAVTRADLAETVPFPDFMAAAARIGSGRIGTVYCSGFLPDSQRYPELASVRCPAGTTKLGIMPDGSVYPCNLFFGRPGFLLGNLFADPFERIWRHRSLDFFRSPPPNRCTQTACDFHGTCHGGCPAQALVLTGDLAGPDPRCSVRS